MEFAALIDRLETNAATLRRTLESVSHEQAAWQPAPGRWSMLEVAAHLLDEEREDFPARLKLLLESPESAWPPIDPEGWVKSRSYAERDLEETVQEFVSERARSVSWLRSLINVDWGQTCEHPQQGTLRAGDLLASWVAHDALHLRQLAGLEWAWCKRLADPYSPAYAGDW